jgi:hypothetical protein
LRTIGLCAQSERKSHKQQNQAPDVHI